MIELECPRCKRNLTLADEYRGQYAFCKYCEGRLWVPSDALVTSEKQGKPELAPPPTLHDLPEKAVKSEKSNSLTKPSPWESEVASTPPPQRLDENFNPSESSAHSGNNQNIVSASNSPPPHPADKTAGESKPAPQRHATLITAEPAKSRLNTAADGQLPELTLETLRGDEKDVVSSNDPNRLLVFGVVCGSLLVSALLLLLDISPLSNSQSETNEGVRQIIKRKYFGSPTDPWDRYQIYLRDAALARSQRNFLLEQRFYRKVLHLLNAQNLDSTEEGVTGLRRRSSNSSLRSDEELMELISRLLKTNN
tara:strand:- start:467 stop:1393 length:927 start_codon:yes stop_codon:yes gene_type:complete